MANFNKLTFPSEHQYVIIDTEIEKVTTRALARIPLTFKIQYNGEADDPPELTLFVNPRTMNVSKTQKINVDFGRLGNIVEDWGPHQDVLSFEGKIGAYYVSSPSVGSAGLNRYDRTKSLSFKNLYSLLLMYRNNGAIYEKTEKTTQSKSSDRLIKNTGLVRITRRVPKIVESTKNRILKLGDVFILYDKVVYQGAFDELTITEDSSMPYTLNYSFTFTVQRQSEADFRDFRYYNQVIIESGDISKNQGHVRRVLKSALSRTNRAQAEEIATLDGNTTFVNPSDLSTTAEINRNNLVTRTESDYNNELIRQGITPTPEQRARYRADMRKMASDDFSTANTGFNDLTSDTKQTLLDNGRSETQASNEASNLASMGKTKLENNKKRIK